MKKILLKVCIFIYIATLIIGLYVNYVNGNINDFFMIKCYILQVGYLFLC